jgi:hypothetical protein
MKRPFADTLLDLVEGILRPAQDAPPVAVTSLRLDVPMEVRLGIRDGEWEFLADVPQWRWQTGWEERRGRLRVNWSAGGAP